MTKIAGSGSGSTSQSHGSADPDPPQNVMDPQHCFPLWWPWRDLSCLTLKTRTCKCLMSIFRVDLQVLFGLHPSAVHVCSCNMYTGGAMSWAHVNVPDTVAINKLFKLLRRKGREHPILLILGIKRAWRTNQCFGSVFIRYRSRSGILGLIHIQIRIQSRSRVLIPKSGKNLQQKKINFFLNQKLWFTFS